VTDLRLNQVMGLLGLRRRDFLVHTADEFEALKQRTRRRFRQLAKTHHPDCTEDKDRMELFRFATIVMRDLEDCKFEPPRARLVQRRRYRMTVT
jgi:hypothetical protein